ncbi:MAG: DUF1553 domain-containing protein [Planctomycetaceae bacterium]|nr:MAG: DUF1553 domain-containing protein [Planctomycetaceae bacterium]
MHDEASQTGGFLDSLVAGIGGPDGGWNGCKERERPRRRILGRTCAASVALAISLLLPAAWGEESSEPLPTTSETSFFETKVRPILVEHCYECHSVKAGAAEGGLLVDSRVAIRQGGDSGPGVVPGDPEASLVLTAISHSDPDLKMPPKRSRLPGSVIADLTKWIEGGAVDPREDDAAKPSAEWDLAKARDHWAYQPLIRGDDVASEPAAPETDSHQGWPRSFIDMHVLEKLTGQGLRPSPDAAPQTLLRRLHFDLTGLPPTPEDQSRFASQVAAAGMPAAMRSEADRLLELPQFGERWGRHWLDVARFGESSGKEANISFPYAWRFRDYVIDAFNDDVPFDRFLTEQIAGDQLDAQDDAERARLLIATGFLAIGTKNLDEANVLQFHADLIDEQIDTVTRAVMASSVACARCHDHKFDPFSMVDYYGLAGVFASTETFFGTSVSPANRIGGTPLALPVRAEQPIFHASISAERVTKLKAELADLQRQEKEGREAVRKAIAAGEDPSGLFTLTDALKIFWRTGAIRGELNRVSETGEALPLAMAVQERPTPIDVPLLQRGDISKPGDTVPRGFPSLIEIDPPVAIPKHQSGRLELAHWLTHPQHPLTSRVIVNRVWKHLFGAGIVKTVDDFGTTGALPSHPELLDELASRFMRDGWSVKRLVREIVLSRSYQQASDFDAAAFQIDPDNRWLWRQAKRRLEAEAIRDAMLAVSGELDPNRPDASLVGRVIGDRPMSLIGLDKRLPSDLDGSVHRSVYLPVVRDRLPDVLDLFDFAEASSVTGQRETTNVPIQALYWMNSPFVQDRAEAFASRLLGETSSDSERIDRAFRLCFNRPPEESEAARSLEFLETFAAMPDREPGPNQESDAKVSGEPSVKPWVAFCQAMLAAAEFRNLD